MVSHTPVSPLRIGNAPREIQPFQNIATRPIQVAGQELLQPHLHGGEHAHVAIVGAVERFRDLAHRLQRLLVMQGIHVAEGAAQAIETLDPRLIQLPAQLSGARGTDFGLFCVAVHNSQPRLHTQRECVLPHEPGYFCTGGRAARKMHGAFQAPGVEQRDRIAIAETCLLRR